MAGHSHWQNIKHKKQREDRKKGKLFTRLSEQISSAVREGGKDPDFNPSLRSAIEEARDADMPQENIKTAVERGAGEGDYARATHVLEAYGPGGIAFLVKVETDNKNRTVSEIRNLFRKFSGSLGEAGSSAYIFENSKPTFTCSVKEEEQNRVQELIKKLQSRSDVVEVLHNAKV